MIATVGSLLDQVPSVDGVKFKVSPSQSCPPFGTVIVGEDGSFNSYVPLSIVEQLFNDTSIGEYDPDPKPVSVISPEPFVVSGDNAPEASDT